MHEPACKPSGTPCVLMVDDDLELLEEYRELLECDGLTSAICNSPIRAVDMLRATQSIQVVVSDLRMNGMDGITMIKAMRSAAPDRQLAFALVTGATEIDPDFAGHDVRVLYKPVDPDELIATITELLP